YVPTNPYKAEWTDDKNLRSPYGHDVNNSNSNNDGQYTPPLSPRNPQTPSEGEEFGWALQSGDFKPRGPQGYQ
ncbi:hypothetical protein BG015_002516, partial [Linnemannia schmuckeri]